MLIAFGTGHAGRDRLGVDQDVMVAAAGLDRARRLHGDVVGAHLHLHRDFAVLERTFDSRAVRRLR